MSSHEHNALVDLIFEHTDATEHFNRTGSSERFMSGIDLARKILASDWLAEHDKAIGERIAVAIEAHWNQDGVLDAAAQYQASVDADLARADALTEGASADDGLLTDADAWEVSGEPRLVDGRWEGGVAPEGVSVSGGTGSHSESVRRSTGDGEGDLGVSSGSGMA